jgi:DNA (cytosine-5)-methyltransferase 1
MKSEHVKLIVIDSFCGAGGVTEGFHRATDKYGNKICKVIIGINHDEVAIQSHASNHPDTIHFVEDFTALDANRLLPIVDTARVKYPNAKVLFWASAECTHHSKAKGGLPRDADSRSLPEHIERYARVINPDVIGVENVVEFLDWGPLNENGKPIKEEKGIYYTAWRDALINLGYLYGFRKLNAADYGAYTSRIRYFGMFSKASENIAFPVQTHSKNGVNGLERWRAVKDVLDLDVEGESIFGRKKPLVDATLERIIAGIERFVIYRENDPSLIVSCQSRIGVVKAKFISKAFSGRPQHKNQSIDNPAGTITTVDHHQLLTAYYGNGYNSSIQEPAGTITTKDRFALVTSKFMDQQYGMSKPVGINQPLGCLTANPKFNLVSAQWLMDTQFKNKGRSINEPGPTITANRKQFYLMNPQFSNKGGSINRPCFTLIARMDKMPPYLIEARKGEIKIKTNESDSEVMKCLKTICNRHGIIDIMMRMLMIDELLRIQGFGDEYKLKGTKAEMKKFIGNAVECNQAKVIAEAIAESVQINQIQCAV